MKKEAIAFLVGVALLIAAVLGILILMRDNERLKEERDRYIANTEVLSSDVEKYKVQDSLSAAKVRSLEISLEEFERYRASDAALIKQLKQKNRDLESITNTQSETIVELMAAPKDTVIISDSVPVKAKAVRCGDPWYDFEGLMTEDNFAGKLRVRDSLIVSESVEHKRFLGFLWKTKKVKNRQMDVVSRNPHTEIQDIVYVVIED